MASIRVRDGKWQARVSRKGFPSEVKTFDTKRAASEWARAVETNLDRGTHVTKHRIGEMLLKDVLQRYLEEVTPRKKGAREEFYRIRAMQRRKVAQYSMSQITPEVVAAERDERLKSIGAGAVLRDILLISAVFNYARIEWKLQCQNPVPLVRKPIAPKGRNRILTTAELDRLFHDLAQPGSGGRRNPLILPITKFALATAMRRGEILGLLWQNVDIHARTAYC